MMRQFSPDSGDTIFDATGKATILLTAVKNGAIREIERIVLTTTSALATTCGIYEGAVEADDALRDYSTDANKDISVNNPPLRLPGNKPILVVFSGGTVGAKATVNLTQYIADDANGITA